MNIEKKQVEKIAKLSRIRLKDGEADKASDDLNKIFNWIEKLQEVNTDNVPEMAGVGGYTLRVREDKVTDGDVVDKVLKNAPESSYGCFVVPKVV